MVDAPSFAPSVTTATTGGWLTRLLLGCVFLNGMMAVAQEETAKRSFNEPKIAPASSEAEEALGSFRMPEGWTVNLFAAEPDVANPVAFFVDQKARVAVCETYRLKRGVTDNRDHDDEWLKADLAAQTVSDRMAYYRRLLGDSVDEEYSRETDLLRLLVDEDGDGRADRSTVFADGFHAIEDGAAAGVLLRGQDAYFACIPKLYLLTDSDGDGRADKQRVLHDGFGVRVAFSGHDLHGLIIGPDGRLYFSVGDRGFNLDPKLAPSVAPNPSSGAVLRCELDGSNLEVVATGLRNPQELAFDQYGTLFTWDNNSDSGDRARWCQIVPGGDSGWRMYYQYLPDRGPFNREKIWHPYHREQPAYIVPPIDNLGDGPSGIAYYPGTGLGEEWKDFFFLVDFRGGSASSGIRAIRVEPVGAFYRIAESASPLWNILATDLGFAPDGSMLVSDWVNGWVGEGKGRIYRFSAPQHADPEVKQLLGGDWTKLPADRLAVLLGHRDQRIRMESQLELARRGGAGDGSARRVLVDAVSQPSDTEHRLARMHAAWGLGQISRKSSDDPSLISTLTGLLKDSDPMLRALAATTCSETGALAAASQFNELLADPEPRVQAAALLALAKHPQADSFDAIIKILSVNDDRDPIIRHAAIMALAGLPADADESIARLLNQSSVAVRRAAVVALRRRGSDRLVEFLVDSDPLVLAEAVRAIHDLPLPSGFEELAALLDRQPHAEDAVLRRAINANFRLGTPASARRLANFAATRGVAPQAAAEAIRALTDWAAVDGRDRVLNDWRPIDDPKRASEAGIAVVRDAVSGALSGLVAADESVRQQALALAAHLGIQEVKPFLQQRVLDGSLDALGRSEALAALASVDRSEALSFARNIGTDAPDELRIAALQTRWDAEPDLVVQDLISATGAATSRLRQAAWNMLQSPSAGGTLGKASQSAIDQHVAEGIRQYLTGKLPPDCWLEVLTAAQGRLPADLAKQLETRQREVSEEFPIGPYLAALEGGDPAAGERLFYTRTELSCVRCHRAGGRGGDVGPNLAGLAALKDRRYLLESLVLPDAQIAEGYEPIVIADDLGTVTNGIFKGETDEYIDIVTPDGNPVRIDKETIVERRRGQSAMPVDVVKKLPPHELRDLVAFLATLTKPAAPLSAADAE